MPSRKKSAPSSPEPKIEFPAEDHQWLALQQRVIELTEKPIEDLSPRELQEVCLDLPDSEQDILKEYLRRRRLETSHAFSGIVSCRVWQQERCTQTLEDLIDFQDYLRALVVTLHELPDSHPLLDDLEMELFNFLDGFPGAEVKPNEGRTWNQNTRMLRNIARVPPTDEGMEFVETFYEQLKSREGQVQEEESERIRMDVVRDLYGRRKRVIKIEVIQTQPDLNFQCEFTARTELEAFQEAIRAFDVVYPNARQNNLPIRARATHINGSPTYDYKGFAIRWDSEWVKSIKWRRPRESRHARASQKRCTTASECDRD